jgi:hypothetical protein
LITSVAALLAAVWLGSAPASEPPARGSPKPTGKPAKVSDLGETCGNYGTSVHFVASPSEAAQQALKEEKLVFVLHVSGLFEDPDFT